MTLLTRKTLRRLALRRCALIAAAMPPWVECSCPAKINLFLAVTGKRPDGFHDLVSLVAQLDLEDHLRAEFAAGDGPDTLECSDPGLPTGPENLVLKASRAFRQLVNGLPPVRFTLRKHIPTGAGLGGGSSDAAGALRLLNQLAGNPLQFEELKDLAAQVGSDCPLFLYDGPVIMRGRGESITPVRKEAATALHKLQLLLIKPHFGIRTDWAYQSLAAAQAYDPVDDAENSLSRWEDSPSSPIPLANTFEQVVFSKYLIYPAIAQVLEAEALPRLTLSGSGSACFVLLDDRLPEKMKPALEKACGNGSLVLQTVTK